VPIILLVEDNDDDADLTILAFKEANVDTAIVRAQDGVEALDYIFSRGTFAKRRPDQFPSVVLLDLKLPRLGGLEVLKEIRESPQTRCLPVVVLTSSAEDRDRTEAYSRFANSYVRKPVDYDAFVRASRDIGMYWTVTNVPPPVA
jgi:two-component system response regulator